MYYPLRQSNFSNVSILNIIALIHKGYTHFENHIQLPYSKYAISLLQLLLRNNFIAGYKVLPTIYPCYKRISVKAQLLYTQNLPMIYDVHITSTPSRRKYITLQELRSYKCKNIQSIPILNTNLGLLTGDEAISAQIGGEIICIFN